MKYNEETALDQRSAGIHFHNSAGKVLWQSPILSGLQIPPVSNEVVC